MALAFTCNLDYLCTVNGFHFDRYANPLCHTINICVSTHHSYNVFDLCRLHAKWRWQPSIFPRRSSQTHQVRYAITMITSQSSLRRFHCLEYTRLMCNAPFILCMLSCIRLSTQRQCYLSSLLRRVTPTSYPRFYKRLQFGGYVAVGTTRPTGRSDDTSLFYQGDTIPCLQQLMETLRGIIVLPESAH